VKTTLTPYFLLPSIGLPKNNRLVAVGDVVEEEFAPGGGLVRDDALLIHEGGKGHELLGCYRPLVFRAAEGFFHLGGGHVLDVFRLHIKSRGGCGVGFDLIERNSGSGCIFFHALIFL